MTDKASIRPDMVKPLEWVRAVDPPFWIMARTPFGSYRVHRGQFSGSGWWFWFNGGMGSGPSGTEEQARAAAQADYASRIASALSPAFIERIAAMEAENARLRESVRVMHRRAQSFEAASLSMRDQLKALVSVYRHNLRPERGYLRFGMFHALSGVLRRVDKIIARTTLQEHAEDGDNGPLSIVIRNRTEQ